MADAVLNEYRLKADLARGAQQMPIKVPNLDMNGADVAHWQRFLKSRGLYRGDINGRLDRLTEELSFP